jgi:hypothetical protein
MTAPHPILGPTDDTVHFFQPRGMVFVTMLWVIAAGWLVFRGLYLLMLMAFGIHPSSGEIASTVANLLIVPTVGASLILLVAWNSFGELRSSVHGLDFAATGRRSVHLPWSEIASVGLRHKGPFTELVVIPSSPEAATLLPGRGRRPRMHRGGRPAFLIDVGLMSPGPAVLLAELHRRLPSKV